MKRTIRMTAHDGNGTRVEVKFNLISDHLVRDEMGMQVADAKDALMLLLPKIRYGKFCLSDARFK